MIAIHLNPLLENHLPQTGTKSQQGKFSSLVEVAMKPQKVP